MNLLPDRSQKFHTAFLCCGLVLSVAVFIFAANDSLSLLTSGATGSPSIVRRGKKETDPFSSTGLIRKGDRLITGPSDTVDIRASENIALRMLPDTEIEADPPPLSGRTKTYTFILRRGTLLAAQSGLGRNETLKIVSGTAEMTADSGVWSVISKPGEELRIPVSMGSVTVRNRAGKTLLLSGGEEGFARQDLLEKSSLGLESWKKAYDAYLIFPRTDDFRFRQLGLARTAGTLFGPYAYYLGDFFTNDQGFFQSYVFRASSGETVLKLFFDLQERDSFAGSYIQMRDLFLNEFGGFSFDVRRSPGLDPPAAFQIEFKNQQKVIAGVRVTEISGEWTHVSKALDFRSPAPVTEAVVIVFQRDSGVSHRGGFELRRLELEPRAGKEGR